MYGIAIRLSAILSLCTLTWHFLPSKMASFITYSNNKCKCKQEVKWYITWFVFHSLVQVSVVNGSDAISVAAHNICGWDRGGWGVIRPMSSGDTLDVWNAKSEQDSERHEAFSMDSRQKNNYKMRLLFSEFLIASCPGSQIALLRMHVAQSVQIIQ